MKGHDYSQEEIDAYTGIILEKNGKDIPKFPKINGKTSRKFKDGDYKVDPTTKRLFLGVVADETSIDHGEKRWVLAKTNLVDQDLVKEYLLRQFVFQPETLDNLRRIKRGTQKGERSFLKIFHHLLDDRFELCPQKFITEGVKGQWNLACFCTYAKAYVDLCKECPSISSDLPKDSAVNLQVQRNKELINTIICHCDTVFDNTVDDLDKIKKDLKQIKEDHDTFQNELTLVHERIDDYDAEMELLKSKNEEQDTRLEVLEGDVRMLRKELEQQKLQVVSQTNQHEVQTDQKYNCWKSLSTADLERIERALESEPEKEIVGKVRGKDFRTLRPKTNLNDVIIINFLCLLQDVGDCHIFSPFFITRLLNRGKETKPNQYEYENVKEWTTKYEIDIFNKTKVFVPIVQSRCHWILAVIDIEGKKIQLYDSYLEYIRPRGDLLQALLRYLQDEHEDKKKCPLPEVDQWKLIDVQIKETPIQENKLDFTQAHITDHGRNFIGHSILQKKVD